MTTPTAGQDIVVDDFSDELDLHTDQIADLQTHATSLQASVDLLDQRPRGLVGLTIFDSDQLTDSTDPVQIAEVSCIIEANRWLEIEFTATGSSHDDSGTYEVLISREIGGDPVGSALFTATEAAAVPLVVRAVESSDDYSEDLGASHTWGLYVKRISGAGSGGPIANGDARAFLTITDLGRRPPS